MRSIPAFPGLLRPGAAVAAHYVGEPAPLCMGVLGAITANRKGEHVAHIMLSTSGCIRFPLSQVRLDCSHSFGRHCAREWLAEQGHATQEDRAEVLALSVQSVRQGGGLVLGVVGAWGPYGGYPGGSRCYRDPVVGEGYACVTTGECAEWWAGTGRRYLRGPETGNIGKAACDAALLQLGYALTNPDGSLTLPPLPEVPRG